MKNYKNIRRCLIMKFELKMDKEQLKSIGNAGLRIGKAIVIEGTKALVVKTAVKAINTGFEGGKDGIKGLTLDDVVGKKKDKEDKPKKKWFSKKKDEVEELIEEVTEDVVDEDDVEVIHVEAELVD